MIQWLVHEDSRLLIPELIKLTIHSLIKIRSFASYLHTWYNWQSGCNNGSKMLQLCYEKQVD